MTTIIIKDLQSNVELGKKEMGAVAGGWWDYNPYYSFAYNSGYNNYGSFGYTPSYYGFDQMGSWLYNQGSIDAGHDSFIDYIWS